MDRVARNKKTKSKSDLCYLWRTTKNLLSAKLFLNVGMLQKTVREDSMSEYHQQSDGVVDKCCSPRGCQILRSQSMSGPRISP